MKDLAKRLPTTAVLIVIAYTAIRYLPPRWFAALLFVLTAAAAWELLRLAKPHLASFPVVVLSGAAAVLPFVFHTLPLPPLLIAALLLNGLYFLFRVRRPEDLPHFIREFGLHALGVFYLFFPLFYLLELQELHPHYLFYLIFVIAVGDSGAYFVGSAIGKHKIYPVASPKKSLEGLIAAVLTAGLSGWLSILLFPLPRPIPVLTAVWVGAVIGLFSQLSDPVESLFKRAAGVKDSGSILPGHGGLLDRLDSYIFCAPLLYYLILWCW